MDIEYIPGDLVMVKESALRFAKDKPKIRNYHSIHD